MTAPSGPSSRLARLLLPAEADDSRLARVRRKASRNVELGALRFVQKGFRFVGRAVTSTFALRGVQKVGVGVRVQDKAPVIQNRGGVVELGDGVFFDAPVTPVHFNIEPGATLTIGDHTYLNDAVWIGVTGRVTIGRRVRLGPGVRILDNSYHGLYERSKMPAPEPVTIEDDVWIASDSMIMPGVTVGRGAVVGAHSLVTKDVPPFTVAVGNPARVVKQLDPDRLVP